jgi:hypothetical protein
LKKGKEHKLRKTKEKIIEPWKTEKME